MNELNEFLSRVGRDGSNLVSIFIGYNTEKLGSILSEYVRRLIQSLPIVSSLQL